MLSASSAMIPLRAAALYTSGLLVAFAAGWYFKPAPAPGTSGQATDGANRRAGIPASLAGRPVGTAGGTWLDAATADVAAVRGAARPGELNQVLTEKLGAVLAISDPVERLARWSALLPLMRPEDTGAIRAILWKNVLQGRDYFEEAGAFWRRWGMMDPAAALACSTEKGDATSYVLSGWARRDSAAALAWIKGNRELVDFRIRGLMKGLAAGSPEAAVELLLANGDDPIFSQCLHMATDLVIQRQGITAAWQWFTDLAESEAPAAFKAENLERLLFRGNIPADAAGTPRKMELAQTAARYVGEPWFSKSAADTLGEYMGEADPVAGAGLIGSFTDTEAKEHFISSLLNEWLSKDAASVGEWLDRNRASSSFDAMAFLLARHISEEDPEAARRWSAQISDPGWRERLETQLSWDQEN